MPKTRRQDALDISPSLEVGCRTVGSWLLLATAGSGKEGRCHTGHAQPRPVAETGPRREARRRFTESRWDRGCAGREVPGRRPGADPAPPCLWPSSWSLGFPPRHGDTDVALRRLSRLPPLAEHEPPPRAHFVSFLTTPETWASLSPPANRKLECREAALCSGDSAI